VPNIAQLDSSEFLSEIGTGESNFMKLRKDLMLWRSLIVNGSTGVFGQLRVRASFNLVAINAIFPSFAFSYWKSDFLGDYGTTMDTVTLLGLAFGSLVLGYLADKHGRRAVYGWEVLLTLLGTWNLVLGSDRKNPAGIKLVRMAAWRLILEIGVGSEHPLSAVITAE
jgi:MFS family permease